MARAQPLAARRTAPSGTERQAASSPAYLADRQSALASLDEVICRADEQRPPPSLDAAETADLPAQSPREQQTEAAPARETPAATETAEEPGETEGAEAETEEETPAGEAEEEETEEETEEESEGEAAEEEAEEDTEAGAGAAAGGGSASRGGGDTEAAGAFQPAPIPMPDTSSVAMERRTLDLGGTEAPLVMPRYLRIEPRDGKGAVPPRHRNYERAFADTVSVSDRLHREFVNEGREAANALTSIYSQVEAQAQRFLDDTLSDLAQTLSSSRAALAQAEQDAILRLGMQADQARGLIRAAAGSAYATIAARKGVMEGRVSLARDAALDVEIELAYYASEVDRAGPPASQAFTALNADPSTAHVPNTANPSEAYSPQMQTAENEPLDPAVQHRAGDRSTAFTQAQTVFAGQLADASTQFQTAALNAFQPFQQYIDMLGTPARDRIGAMRSNAIRQVNRTEREAADGVRRSRNQVEIGLVERYQRSREQVIGTTERAGRSQHGAVERAGQGQLQGFRAAASAQGGTIVALEQEIAKQRESSPEEFAGYVSEASARTAERAEETGGSRRQTMRGTARQMRQLTSGRAASAIASQERSAQALSDQLEESARRSGVALMTQVLALETALRQMAQPVAAVIDQFPIPAQAELDTMEEDLWTKLGEAREQAHAAYFGGNGPRSEAPPPPPPANPPPAGTGSNPSQFVEKSDAFAISPHTEEHIVALTTTITEGVIGDVGRRGDGLIGQMDLLNQNPQETLSFVRGLTYKRGQAVIKYYNVEKPGDLWDDIAFYMSFGNLVTGVGTRIHSGNAVYNYLLGNRAEGALEDVQAATEWWNNADQVRDAMTELSAADLGALRGLEGATEVLDSVEQDLEGADRHMFQLLRTATEENARERVAAARSVQLEARIEEALQTDPERGADNAHDLMEAAALSAGSSRLEGAMEFGLTADFQFETAEQAEARRSQSWQESVARLGNQGERWENGVQGGVAYLRDIASRRRIYQVGETYSVATLRPQQQLLLVNMAEFGPGAPQTRGAQIAVEATRPGGAKPERYEHALHDPDLNPDMDNPDRDAPRPGEPPTAFQERLERARRREEEMYRYYDEITNGPRGDAPPRPVSEIRAEVGRTMRAGQTDERQGRLMEMQAVRGLTDPQTAALAFEHAVDRWGTDEDLLKRTFGRMSADQIDAAVGHYDDNHSQSLYDRLGLFEHSDRYFRELSGDDRIQLQVLAVGQPRNPRERAQVSRMSSHLQRTNAGWAGRMLAGEEHRRLVQSHDRLLEVMGVEETDFDARGRLRVRGPNGERLAVGNFDERGQFVPTAEHGAAEFTLLMAHNERNADAYRVATDNIANAITTTLVVAAAIISTIATGGAAASIWIPVLVTAGAGLVGMAASLAIKGGRYGYEDAGRDFGMTLVQAATAGIGASLTIARAGGTAALRTALTSRMVSNVGFRSLGLVEEAVIAGASGAVSGGGSAMFDDRAWDRGEWLTNIGHGMQRGFLGGFAGGIVTGASTRAIAGAARGLGQASGTLTAAARGRTAEVGARLGRLRGAAYAQSFPTSLAGRTIGGGIGGGVTRWAEIEYDRRRGVYQGSRAQAWEEVSNAAAQNSIQSFLEGIGERASDESPTMRAWRDSIMAGQRPPADLPPAVRPPPELDAAAQRPDSDEAVAARRPVEEGAVAPSTARPDEAEAPTRRTTGPEEDEPAMLRSAAIPEDEDAQLRSTFDPDKTPPAGIQIVHPTFPNGVDLQPGMLATLPHILPDTVVRPVNPADGVQARQNYDLMRTHTPNREVLLAHNPMTGEYIVVQGLPGRVRPPPEGWVTLRHSHGRVSSTDRIRQLMAVLPTAIGGDFSVLRTEMNRLAGAELGVTVRRASAIDIDVNGTHVQTTFEITRTGDNYSLTVTIDPAVHGVSTLGPFFGDRDTAMRGYAYHARDLVDGMADFGLTKPPPREDMMSAGGDGPGRVVRSASPAEAGRHESQFAGQRTAEAEAADPRRVGGAVASFDDRLSPVHHGDIESITRRMDAVIAGDPVFAASRMDEPARYEALQRVRTPADVQEAVVRMGLVDRPDAMVRLQAVLSDSTLTPQAREHVARAVLDATRESLRRRGALAEADDLTMIFHGAPEAQIASYRQGGIDMGRALPRAGEHDLGPGTYVSRDFQSALLYVGEGGRVLPAIVPHSRLGQVIDISPGSPLRARWEEFVLRRGGNVSGVKLEYGPEAMRAVQDAIMRGDFGFRPSFDQIKVSDGRGQLVEAFLAHLADDPTLPPSVREAARRPDIIFADLGGPATSGTSRGFMTDQATIRTQRLADVVADQLGFPRLVTHAEADMLGGTGRTRAPDEEDMLRSALPPETSDSDDKAVALPAPVVDAVAAVQPVGPVEAHIERALPLVSGRMETGGDAWETFARLMLATDPVNAFDALTAPDEATRRAALERFRQKVLPDLGPEHAERRMRQLDHLAARGGQALRIEYEHAVRLAAIGNQLDKLPPQVRTWAAESPVLLLFAMRDPVRLEQLFTRFVAKNSGASLTSLEFERHVLTKERKGDAALYVDLRTVKADRPGEDRARSLMVTRQQTQGFTYRAPEAAEPLPPPGTQPHRPIETPDQLAKGLRVDHPQHGRGTVESVVNGVAHIHFDSDPPGVQRQVAHADDKLSRAADPDPRFGDPPPHRDNKHIQDEIDEIMDFRSSALLPEFSQDADTGTVARIVLGGEVFHGTSAGLDPPNYSLRNKRRQEIFDRLRTEFGLKVPDDLSQNAMFLGHAEAEAMLLAYDHFGRLPEVLEIYVDRSTCNDCRNNMVLLARMLGVKEVRVYYRNQTNPPLVRR